MWQPEWFRKPLRIEIEDWKKDYAAVIERYLCQTVAAVMHIGNNAIVNRPDICYNLNAWKLFWSRYIRRECLWEG